MILCFSYFVAFILPENVKLGKKMNSLGSHPSVNQEKKKRKKEKEKKLHHRVFLWQNKEIPRRNRAVNLQKASKNCVARVKLLFC